MQKWQGFWAMAAHFLATTLLADAQKFHTALKML